MAKNKITHVQLESGAFLSDPDFAGMNAEERGIYCSIIFYLYENGGAIKCEKNGTDIALLCGCYKTGNDWLCVWEKVGKKFLYKRGRLLHKRVSRELAKARQKLQAHQKAGLRGAKKRWQGDSNAIGSAMALVCNRSEAKSNTNRSNISNSKEQSSSVSNSLRLDFDDRLRKILPVKTQSDITGYRNIGIWLDEQVNLNKFNQDIFMRVLDYAFEAAKNRKSRNPRAVFMAMLKKEIGYRNGDTAVCR